MHVASTFVRYAQLFPNTVSDFHSHIHHFDGCKTLHHVEITPFPSVTEGSHPACLVYLDSFGSEHFARDGLSEGREPLGEGCWKSLATRASEAATLVGDD